MDLVTRRQLRLLCTEPLEGRRLLSAPGLPEVDDGDGSIEIVEFEFADDGDDGDVVLSPSELPPAVLAAFQQRFPGASVLEAEFSLEDDGSSEYDVAARFKAGVIAATLTHEGEVLETEQTLTSDDLPRAVLDWVRRNFPGAEIGEASMINEDGDVSYEVLIEDPGQGELEATLRVEPAQPAAEAPDAPAQAVTETVPESPAPQADAPTAWLAEPITDQAGLPLPEDAEAPLPEDPDAEAESPVTPAPNDDQRQRGPQSGKSPFNTTGGVRASPFALSFRAIIPAEAPRLWLAQVADLLADGLPLDAGAVEASLAALLTRIESLTDATETQESDDALVLRLLLVAALVGGAQLLLMDSRRSKAGPVLVFSAAASSWSWVLGAPPPGRH